MTTDYRVVFADLKAEETEARLNELAAQGYQLACVINSHWDGRASQLVMERVQRNPSRIPGPGELTASGALLEMRPSGEVGLSEFRPAG